MDKKYLHLFYIDKFTLGFINFINTNFDSSEHLFIVFGKKYSSEFDKKENVIKISKSLRDLIFLIKKMYVYKNIFLHGLFDKRLISLLFIFPTFSRKSDWIVWGGDLYDYKLDSKNIRERVFFKIKTCVIKNIKGVITCVKGDYDLAVKIYGFHGKYNECFMYPSNVFKDYDLYQKRSKDDKIYIQIGNSADSSNNHLEIFRKLEAFKHKNIEIVCVLSYGDCEYKKYILNEGYNIFGDKFKPILDFLPLEQYLDLLKKVDIAIFNHRRQQAMGNIVSLIGFGKKVYIRNDITTWDFFKDLKIRVHNTSEPFDELFNADSSEIIQSNIDIVKTYFSEKALKNCWEKIFKIN